MKFEEFSKKQSESELLQKPYILETKNDGGSPAEEHSGTLYAEPSPETINLNILQSNLGNCLSIIDDEVMKGYVKKLSKLPIIHPDSYIQAGLNNIHFFKISELVYQEDEFSVDKLAMIFHTLSNSPCTLAMMLRSDGEETNFYLGVRSNSEKSSGTMFQMLRQSLLGFFPGSKIEEYYDEDMEKDMELSQAGGISSVTCIADYKQERSENKDFIQGLEKFVYAMRGKPYSAVFIADNLSSDELLQRKRDYEQIYTQISPFANMQMNFTVSDGSSTSEGTSRGAALSQTLTKSMGTTESKSNTETYTYGSANTVGTSDTKTYTNTKSESDGTARTKGTSEGTSQTITDGKSFGGYAGVGFKVGSIGVNTGLSAGKNHSVAEGTSRFASVSESVSKTLTHGFSDSKGFSSNRTYSINESDSTAQNYGTAASYGRSDALGTSFNLVNTKTLTDTFGTSKGVTLNAKNMTLNLVMERLQKHLARIEECESFGMWNFAAYFVGESIAETETAANTYKSVISGTDSGIECSAINSWADEASVKELYEYIRHFIHPKFVYSGFSYDEQRYIAADPSALVSTNELAIHMGLPRRSVRGLPVVEHVPFAQEVITHKPVSEKRIYLGKIFNLGCRTNTDVSLDLNSLSMHTFITGSTGSGKSNAIYHLLDEAVKNDIPCLVIEPAKGEYKDIFTNFRCFGTNPLLGEILKINPFSFPKGIHVLEHIDRIVEIFNVCWPMYAAMPAVLKASIEQAYSAAGWDLDLSQNMKIPDLYPTFDDVLRELQTTIRQSDYSADTKGDYIGSLSTRLKSLTNGINGRIFVSDEIPLEDLFDKNAIIDISRVGSVETKALIMGLTVLKLQEYRMEKIKEMNVPLRHLTVLEEAHHLLKKTAPEQNAESSNIMGKSVEIITNAIAEMRTYGEGFVIVDQAPNLLDTAAIRNTNTKIVLRLPESVDREVTGGAIALKEQQYTELSKLPTGVAAVYQNDWQEAVLCTLPKYELADYMPYQRKKVNIVRAQKEKSKVLLHLLLKKTLSKEEKKMLLEGIKSSNVSAKIRKDLILNLDRKNRSYEWAVADFIHKNFKFDDVFRGTSKCENLEDLSIVMQQNLEEEFADFSEEELFAIMYYICRIEHEKYPENKAIEQLRIQYLRERVVFWN